MNRPITRRRFLKTAGAGLLAPYSLIPLDASAALRRTGDPFRIRRFLKPEWVFPESVASGDPTPSGVILWTRINPRIWKSDEPLAFEIALDPRFQRMVSRGLIDPAGIRPEADYTVHLDLNGQLPADSFCYYRFIYRNAASRTGRCRTLPPDGAPIDKLHLGVITCQDYTNGYYGAFVHLALERELDFVLHLGDLIYETTGGTGFQSGPFPDRSILLPSLRTSAMGLDDFRALYRTYRSDRYFQLAMEFHTWIVIWDDHETANDCYWDYTRDTLGAPDHPYTLSARYGNDPGRLRRLKLDAQRAWAEYVPTRITFNESADHPHDAMTEYRSVDFGDLVHLVLTDERTYRAAHPCGEDEFGRDGRIINPGCPERFSPGQTMLGEPQRDWFINSITGSGAVWNAWGNEVFLGPLTIGEPGMERLILNLDAWDGYAGEREFILESLRDAGVRNLVVLTGDLHTFMSSYVKLDYADLSNTRPANILGVEFMTPAVTSSNFAELAGYTPPPPASNPFASMHPRYFLEGAIRANNPHVQFFNSQDWGYSTVTFRRDRVEYRAYAVDKTVNSFRAAKRLIRHHRVMRDTMHIETL